MRWLGWFAFGVGYLGMVFMAVATGRGPANIRRRDTRGRAIESGVQFLVLLCRLAGVRRSISDYLQDTRTPDNVLMHIGLVAAIYQVFARIKGLNDSQTIRGLEMITVHDLSESVNPEGDRPKYDRSELSRLLPRRLKQLLSFKPPRGEEGLRNRQTRYRRALPFMKTAVEGMDSSTKRWILDRFRSFYMSSKVEARLARECDRLSDVFLATYYAGKGEQVDQFWDWAMSRANDPDLLAAVQELGPHFRLRGKEEREEEPA